MKAEDSDPDDTEFLKRYRAANEERPVQPTASTRAAILAEARRITAARSLPHAMKPFDTRRPAANPMRWRMAAVGTAGAALFAVILMVPAYRQQRSNAPDRTAGNTAASALAPQDEMADLGKVGPAPAAAPPPAAMTSTREALARTPPPAAKAAAEPSRDRAETGEVLDHGAATARQEPERRRAAQGVDSTAAAAPMAKLAPAPPPADRLLPSQAPSGHVTRAESAAVLGAVRQGDLGRLTGLLNAGAPATQPDDAGRSPLLVAVLARREDLVRALLAHGADANAADRAGLTPLHAARDRHLVGIATALEQAGAQER